MAAPAAVGQVYLMTLKGTMDGQLILNTQHYLLSNLTAPYTIDDVANDIDAWWRSLIVFPTPYGRYLFCLPPEYNHDQTWIQCIDPVRYRKKVFGGLGAGQSINSGKWANSGQTITRRGDLANRANIGSFHMVLPSTDPGAGGSISGLALAALSNMADVLKLTIPLAGAIGTMEPVLYHRQKVPNFSLITQTVAQTTVRTMHRRTVGLGK